jgi:cytochrome c biogenesis protein CcmG/thiol:disulfide interchange protein DsbE
MSRQWQLVAGVVAVLVLGTAVAMRFAPDHIEVGAIAPDFTAIDLTSKKPVSLVEEYRGDVTLVNIWATWCPPCREEIPALDSLYRALAPEGFRIAAVSIDTKDPETVKVFMDSFHVAFDVLHDREGKIQQIYQTTGVPESFLLDRDGRIVRIVYSDHPWASPANQEIIRRLLAVPAGKGSQ